MTKTNLISSVGVLLVSFTFTGYAANQQNIYDCVNKQTLEQNSTCIADMISKQQSFEIQMQDIAMQSKTYNSEQVLSLMKMNPNDLTIEVVALSDDQLKPAQVEKEKL